MIARLRYADGRQASIELPTEAPAEIIDVESVFHAGGGRRFRRTDDFANGERVYVEVTEAS